jgi:hypothetical protein
MLMLLLWNANNVWYSSLSYQRGFDDDNNDNTVSTKISNNNNDNADLTNINKNNVKHAANNQIKHFVICESCFWCTTYLINNVIAVPKCCPMCNNAKVEVLTVANDL